LSFSSPILIFLSSFTRCMPSTLLRAELERRDYNFPAAQVELFVEHHVNDCCSPADAAAHIARWQVQKVQKDARKRGAAAQGAANQGEAGTEGAEMGGGAGRKGAGRNQQGGKEVCPSCGEIGHLAEACPTFPDNAGSPNGSVLCSAFVVSTEWGGRSAAIGDDVDFWLAANKGLKWGSRTEVEVEWFSIRPANPELYVWEQEDTELRSRRALHGIRLEDCEAGHKLPAGERIRVLSAVEGFRRREDEARNAPRRTGFSELYELCQKVDQKDNEQVLCDGCDKGFHLECLDEETVEHPSNVLEDGVEWRCPQCVEKLLSRSEVDRTSGKEMSQVTLFEYQYGTARPPTQPSPTHFNMWL
jgi:predicted RNA-binding Zn-ribbon protein involved in translation (DUF1610 family)